MCVSACTYAIKLWLLATDFWISYHPKLKSGRAWLTLGIGSRECWQNLHIWSTPCRVATNLPCRLFLKYIRSKPRVKIILLLTLLWRPNILKVAATLIWTASSWNAEKHLLSATTSFVSQRCYHKVHGKKSRAKDNIELKASRFSVERLGVTVTAFSCSDADLRLLQMWRGYQWEDTQEQHYSPAFLRT